MRELLMKKREKIEEQIEFLKAELEREIGKLELIDEMIDEVDDDEVVVDDSTEEVEVNDVELDSRVF